MKNVSTISASQPRWIKQKTPLEVHRDRRGWRRDWSRRLCGCPCKPDINDNPPVYALETQGVLFTGTPPGFVGSADVHMNDNALNWNISALTLPWIVEVPPQCIYDYVYYSCMHSILIGSITGISVAERMGRISSYITVAHISWMVILSHAKNISFRSGSIR